MSLGEGGGGRRGHGQLRQTIIYGSPSSFSLKGTPTIDGKGGGWGMCGLTIALDALREELIEHAGDLEVLLCAGVEGVCPSEL